MQTAEAGLRTVADYMQMPDDGPRYELIEGELLMAPAPNLFHQRIAFNLTLILGNHVEKKRLGKLYFAPFDVILDEHNVLQPDIIFFSNARASALTKAGATGAPDLAIEIISPGAEKRDRELKRKVFARSGVEELWLVLPDKKRIDIYRLAENPGRPRLTVSGSDEFESKLFPGLTIAAAEVFAD
jgi:Uma2 family endonuclease